MVGAVSSQVSPARRIPTGGTFSLRPLYQQPFGPQSAHRATGHYSAMRVRGGNWEGWHVKTPSTGPNPRASFGESGVPTHNILHASHDSATRNYMYRLSKGIHGYPRSLSVLILTHPCFLSNCINSYPSNLSLKSKLFSLHILRILRLMEI